MSSFQTILVPTDYSQNASAALETAIQLAGALGARIRLLHVCAASPLREAVHEGLLQKTDDDETVRHKVEAKHERKMAEFLEPLGERVAAIERTLLFGDPAQQINAYAQEHNVDLIVMGRRGATFADVLLGSVAERVIRHAHCPVVVVRHQS